MAILPSCGSDASAQLPEQQTESPEAVTDDSPAPDEPGETDARAQIDSFVSLTHAVLSNPTRTPEDLTALMGDTFTIVTWQEEGVELASPEAGIQLLGCCLSTEVGVGAFAHPVDFATLLGVGPESMFPDGVRFVLGDGWGQLGKDQAVLVFGQHADGLYYWRGVLFAPGGFVAPQGTDDLSALQNEIRQAVVARDLGAMPSVMADPFRILFWGAESHALNPADAVQEISTFYPPEGLTVAFSEMPDLRSALGGQEPSAAFGGTSLLFSFGWGQNGQGEALLVLAQLEGGSYVWESIVYGQDGFSDSGQGESEIPETNVALIDTENEVKALLAQREFGLLSAMWCDIFTIAGNQAEGADYTRDDPGPGLAAIEAMYPPQGFQLAFPQELPPGIKIGAELAQLFPSAVSFVFSNGWASEGQGEGWLVMSFQPERDTYCWSGLLVAELGFPRG